MIDQNVNIFFTLVLELQIYGYTLINSGFYVGFKKIKNVILILTK